MSIVVAPARALARVSSSSSRVASSSRTTRLPSRPARVSPSSSSQRITKRTHPLALADAAPLDVDADAALDAVTTTDPIVAAAFALAVVLLVVITGGMGYVAFREALDRNEEKNAREEEARQRRVIEANPNKVLERKSKRRERVTPSQMAAMTRLEDGGGGDAAENGGGNRRARRRAARREGETRDEEAA